MLPIKYIQTIFNIDRYYKDIALYSLCHYLKLWAYIHFNIYFEYLDFCILLEKTFKK